jgi:hypothetical protein
MISRRQRRLLAGLAVLGLAAPALPALAAPIFVSGRVTGPEGTAVPGARVRLLSQPGTWTQGLAALRGEADPPAAAEAAVDAGGRFRLEAPGIGLWMVVAEAPGRVPVEVRRLALTDPAEIDPAILFEDAGARFRVFAADGRPAAGALVVLEEDPFFWRSSGGWHPRPRFGRAGAGGAIVLPCARGEVLTARAVGEDGSSGAMGEARDVTGGRITLRAGIQREIAVRSAEGKPAPDVAVFLPDISIPVAVTGQDGRFAVAVPAGGSALFRLLARDGGRGAGKVAATDPGSLTATLSGLVKSTGRVLSAEDRRPLAGALVWADMDPGTLVRTDAAGRYTILRSAGDRFLLRAAAAGHQEAWSTGRAQPRGPVLALEPALVVTGAVVDRRGAPVSGAQVRAVIPEPPHSAHYQMSRYGERAMPEGANGFRIGGLTRGKAYVIEAAAPGFAPLRLELPPLTGDRRAVLALVPGRTAAGRVIDLESKPVAGVEAVLVASPGRLPLSREDSEGVPGLDIWRATTDAGGQFQVADLPEGPLTLRLRKAGFTPLSIRGVEANPEGSLGLWRLTAGDVLRGRVFDESGKPVTGAQVHAGQGFRTLSQGGPPNRKPEAVTGADGSFTIPDLFRWDRFDLWIWKEGLQPGIVQNAEAGWDIDLKTGREIRIVLVPGARLAGRVVDETGTPVPGAWLRLVRDGRRQADSSSDRDGRFVLEGLAPGRADLEISAHGLANAVLPIILPAALAVDQPVEGLEAELRSPASAEGRVLSARGLPVQGIKVRAGDFEEAESDADGWWRIDGLTPGTATLVFAPPEGLPLRREVQIVSPGASRLDVTLPEGREVSGRVRAAAGGAAVAGVQVTVALKGSFPRFEAVSGEDGTFRLTVDANGIYDLVARKEGWADTRMPGLRVEGEPLKGLDVRMGPGATLAGRLIDVGVRADVHGARTVRDVRDIAEVEITAFPADRLQIAGRVDAQERYEVSDLSPGTWTVEARLRGEIWSEARVTIRPEDAGGAPVLLDLRPNARLDQGEPSSSPPKPPQVPKSAPKKAPKKDQEPERKARPLILEPVLTSGQRPLYVTVVLAEQGSDRTFLLSREVGADGLARFPEVTHGQWSLLVSAMGGALTAVRYVTAGGPWAPVHVELPVAGRLIVRMPRDDSASATLVLTGPGGHPHSYLGPAGGLQNVFPVVDGVAVAEGVPAGEWEVTVTASDGRTLLHTRLHTDGTDLVLGLH